MSQLVEQVVEKKKNSRYYLNVMLIIFGTIAIPAMLASLAFIIDLPYMVYVAFFAALFCVYGAWFFISSLSVDYEYAVLTNVMRIDKVIAKRRRKPVVKMDIRTFDDLFRYSDEEMSKQKFNKVYRAAVDEFSENNYVIAFQSADKGRCAAIITPNEDILGAIKPFINSELRKKLFLENRL